MSGEDKKKKKRKILLLLLLLLLIIIVFVVLLFCHGNGKTLVINYNNNKQNSSIKLKLKPGKTKKLDTPSKEGYQFKSWIVNSGDTKIDDDNTLIMGSEESEITVEWEAETYKINYDLNGGKVTKELVTSYNIETDTFELENPIRENYTFIGWTGSNGDKPNTTIIIEKGTTGDKNYKANWSGKTYKINYHLNGGNQENAITEYSYGEDVELSVPTKKGYQFVGWYLSSNFNGKVQTKIEKGATGDKTYYAKWSMSTYSIEYNLNGGTQTNDPITSYTINHEDIKLENPTKEYYKFTGWTGSNGSTPSTNVVIKKGSTGNKTYKANFKAINYTITYNLNGGKQQKNAVTKYSIETKTFNLPTPTKKGYTFVGWYLEGDFTGDVQTKIEKGSTGNKVYYAKWEIVTYNINYNLNDGVQQENAPTTYTVETNTFGLAIPTRDGYNFKGWYVNSGLTGTMQAKIEKGTTGDKTYYAKWSEAKSYVGYNIYDMLKDEAPSDAISSLFVPSSDGIDFNGVSSMINGYGKYKIDSTKNNEYPIYYYRGTVADNNVIFGGFCWKMVRTTETGGTKLIYNGVAVDGKCTKTGVDTFIGTKVKYNTSYSKAETIGYAYTGSHSYITKTLTSVANGTVFANDVSYEDGKYVLIDTYVKDDDMIDNREEIIKTHHYTCLTSSDTCDKVYYIYMERDKGICYIQLSNGEKIDDIIENKAFNPSNTTNSTIKTYVDNWYSQNMTSYTDSLEDTVWCNDRSIDTKGGWDKDTSASEKVMFSSVARVQLYGKPSIVCKNLNDRFTVSSDNGNGVLTYPVGLLTLDEASFSGYVWWNENSSSYLNNGHLWWTMSPSLISSKYSYVGVIYSMLDNIHTAYVTSSSSLTAGGVRPSISLKHSVKIISGTGSINNPFTVE